MFGAITGDIVGSPYEFLGFKSTDFPLFTEQSRFTDDTVLTVAVADALLHKLDFAKTLKDYGRRYADAGFGGSFTKWMHSDSMAPYNSWGNGSAMRTSPIGFFCDNATAVLQTAKQCAEVTHNHYEGRKGAQAVSYGIFLACRGATKDEIKHEINNWFGYDLNACLEEMRPDYRFDVSCKGTVPAAFIAFFESSDYESTVRNAVSLGGDADTLACISGSLAEAFYKEIPEPIILETRRRLPQEFLDIIDEFYQALNKKKSR